MKHLTLLFLIFQLLCVSAFAQGNDTIPGGDLIKGPNNMSYDYASTAYSASRIKNEDTTGSIGYYAALGDKYHYWSRLFSTHTEVNSNNQLRINNLLNLSKQGSGVAGNVGIGTTTPAEKLDVNGAIRLGNTATDNPGTIKWDGSQFLGRTVTAWVDLGQAGGGGGGSCTGCYFDTVGTDLVTLNNSWKLRHSGEYDLAGTAPNGFIYSVTQNDSLSGFPIPGLNISAYHPDTGAAKSMGLSFTDQSIIAQSPWSWSLGFNDQGGGSKYNVSGTSTSLELTADNGTESQTVAIHPDSIEFKGFTLDTRADSVAQGKVLIMETSGRANWGVMPDDGDVVFGNTSVFGGNAATAQTLRNPAAAGYLNTLFGHDVAPLVGTTSGLSHHLAIFGSLNFTNTDTLQDVTAIGSLIGQSSNNIQTSVFAGDQIAAEVQGSTNLVVIGSHMFNAPSSGDNITIVGNGVQDTMLNASNVHLFGNFNGSQFQDNVADNNLADYYSFGEQLVINSGKVGIGTSAPSNMLQVNSSSDVAVRLEGTGNEVAVGASTATLTNSPVAGDPDTYIVINVNGQDLIIAAWNKP